MNAVINDMSTKEAAAAIRATLKKQYGWTSRQVSVQSDCYSMGSSIRVTIKDPAIYRADVEKVAEQYERIHRCEVTGDILGGCNRYVDVHYTSEALEARSVQYLPAVLKAVEERAQHGDNSLIPIDGTKYLLGKTQMDRLSLWSDSFLCEAYTAESIAHEIAGRLRA